MVRGGQMIDVPAGATKLPPVMNVDVNQIMKTNPLITDFPPLPSRDLIYASNNNQAPVPPPGPGPAFVPPIIGSVIGPVIGIPLGPHSTTVHTGGTGHSGSEHTSDGTNGSGKHGARTKGPNTMSGSDIAKPHGSSPPSRRKPSKHTGPG